MIVNVNPQKPEDDNEIKIEGNANVGGLYIFIIIALIFMGIGILGICSGSDVIIGMMIFTVISGVFLLIGVGALMTHYKVKNHWIQLVFGIAFTALGLVVPLFSFGMGCIFIIFAIIGIYLIIKSINSIYGRHEENEELDDQVSSVISGAVREFTNLDEENDLSATVKAEFDNSHYKYNEPLTEEEIDIVRENLTEKVEKISDKLYKFKILKLAISYMIFGFFILIFAVLWCVGSQGYNLLFGIIPFLFSIIFMIMGIKNLIKFFREE